MQQIDARVLILSKLAASWLICPPHGTRSPWRRSAVEMAFWRAQWNANHSSLTRRVRIGASREKANPRRSAFPDETLSDKQGSSYCAVPWL